MLTSDQEDKIIEMVNRSGIKDQILKDDLIDHFCCFVEIELSKGSSFEIALEKAYQHTAPGGLEEIQNESVVLLNRNKMVMMRRLTFITGFIFALLFISGAMFKVLHLPGSEVLLTTGQLGFVFIFVPLLLLNRYKQSTRGVLSEKLKWIFGLVGMTLVLTGSIFKILHLPGAGILLGLSFLVFGFGFLPFLFFTMYKKSVESL